MLIFKTIIKAIKVGKMFPEMPAIPDKIKTLYLDFETTSNDPKIAALSPWRAENEILGAAVTWDGEPRAWYLPICHKYDENLSKEQVFAFLQNAMQRADCWTNHNVKFDAHFYINRIGPLPERLALRCTLVGAKLLNSDMGYAGGYGLDNLSKSWLGKDISCFENAFKPYLNKNKDYSAIPSRFMAPYACQDVHSARELDKHINLNLPISVSRVYATEQRLTRVLIDIEQRGLCVHDQELRLAEFKTRARMSFLEQRLHESCGRAINPSSGNDVFDVLCTQYGLPVLGWTETGEPSFDKYAIARYVDLESSPKNIVNDIAEYRKLSTALTHFIEPYRALNVDGVLHSSYNQIVRTGRMSSREPNSQQLDKATKYFVHPRPGHAFVSVDLSQIEFRLIVHYCENAEAIRAYNEDPRTDFHSLMAKMCGVSRKSAKSLNFAIGFGAGKAKTLAMLAASGGTLEAEKIYNAYHDAMPELKPMSRRATASCKFRGYVSNLFGRRRHIPADFAHIGFNSVIQSTAADLLKDATVRLSDAIRAAGLADDIHIVASVHDETLFEVRESVLEDPRIVRALVRIIEAVPDGIALDVPIRSSTGISRDSWADAGADDKTNMIETGPEDILEDIFENLAPEAILPVDAR